MTAASLPVWSDEALRADSERSVQAFVARRLSEPASAHPRHLKAARQAHGDLLRALATLGDDPARPNLTALRQIILDPRLFAALRYLTAPPISEDDLFTLTAIRSQTIGKRELGSDDTLARRLFHLILALADRGRFPWLPSVHFDDGGVAHVVAPGRPPRRGELRRALLATAPLHAAQSLATERRGFGREVEDWLKRALLAAGFVQDKPPAKGRIDNAKLVPEAGHFYGECAFFGRNADLLIGLPDAFVVAVESKESASTVNSVKRLANDTGAKARTWRDGYGANMATVALISGVFALDTLKRAQDVGVRLVWAHRIDGFVAWLVARAGVSAPVQTGVTAAHCDGQFDLFSRN